MSKTAFDSSPFRTNVLIETFQYSHKNKKSRKATTRTSKVTMARPLRITIQDGVATHENVNQLPNTL